MDWQSRLEHLLDKPITHVITLLVKDLLMPLAEKTRVNAKLDELQSDKDEFSNEDDLILQECLSKDIMCSILRSFETLDEETELQCLYLEKIKECECLANELFKRTKTVGKQDYNELLKSFSKPKKHLISLELALQQYLKAQLQDKNIAISELKKLVEKMKGKGVDTKFEKPSILRKSPLQPLRIQPVVRQSFVYKSKRFSFPKIGLPPNLLRKIILQNQSLYILGLKQSVIVKSHHVNALGPSRNSLKRVSFQSSKESVGSNGMVHNYYIEEDKKNAQL
ncbi:hypothetical protein Tco_1491731 [Tanacetum coccineum]